MDDRQRHGSWIDPDDGHMTLAAWTRLWLPTLNVSERTEENYRRDLVNHVLPRWGDSPLASITGADVQAWAGQLHAAGYPPATVTTLVKLLSRVLGDAVDARLIVDSARRRPHRGPRVLRPVAERVRASPEQVVQVAEHATALGGATMGLLIVTAASIRAVSLPSFLIDLLREHVDPTEGVPVFSGPAGGWLRRSNLDRQVMRPAADGAMQLPTARVRLAPVQPGLTFHGLRRSHKTWRIADGVPEIARPAGSGTTSRTGSSRPTPTSPPRSSSASSTVSRRGGTPRTPTCTRGSRNTRFGPF
jgi:hypothetical protein